VQGERGGCHFADIFAFLYGLEEVIGWEGREEVGG
jgi:hypothetical protein